MENRIAANWSELEKKELIKQINKEDDYDKLYGKLKKSTTLSGFRLTWSSSNWTSIQNDFHTKIILWTDNLLER